MPRDAFIAFADSDYYLWDCSVIRVEGKYHMFSSRWKKELGFGWNWLYNSEIVHAVADAPQGPFVYANTVLPRRGREYFDGMSTHNTCIRQYNGKFYLYYMGTTYNGEPPQSASCISEEDALATWNRKRIGVAVADSINGDFVRRNTPLLSPRDSHWDCTVTTNPAVTILPDGRTYMIYKSRRDSGAPLQLGVAAAPTPEGPFERLSDCPILQFADSDIHVEDPYLWYDVPRKRFCLLAKDDSKNGSRGITGGWGNGFYAESEDCIRFEIPEQPLAYTRKVQWANGNVTEQGNLERPSLLFNDSGEPAYLYCATGCGSAPYAFEGVTYIIGQRLARKE